MADNLKKIDVPSSRHRWRWILLGGLVFFGLLTLLFRPAVEWGLEYGARQWLEKKGAQLTVGAVEVHPWDGWLMLKKIKIQKGSAKPLTVDRFKGAWRWDQLWEKRIHLRGVSVEGVDLAIQPFKEGGLEVAGFTAKDFVMPEKEPTADPSGDEPWLQGWAFDAFTVSRFGVTFDGKRPLVIKRLQVGALQSMTPDAETSIDLALSYGESQLTIKGRAHPLSRDPRFNGRVSLTNLNLAHLPQQLVDVLPMHLRGNLFAKGQLSVALTAAQQRFVTEYDGSLGLGQASLRWSENDRVSAAKVQLNGMTTFENEAANGAWQVRHQGRLDLKNIALMLSDGSTFDASGLKWKGGVHVDQNAATNQWRTENRFVVDGLTVNLPKQELVVRQESLSLQGEVKKGDTSAVLVLFDGNGEQLSLEGKRPLNVAQWEVQKGRWDNAASIKTLLFRQLAVPTGKKGPRLGSLRIDQLALNLPQQIAMTKVTLEEADVHLTRTKEGGIDLGLPLTDSQSTSNSATTESKATSVSPRLRIDHLLLQKQSRLKWSDQSVSSPVSFRLNPLWVEVRGIDTGAPTKKTRFSAKGKLGDHATIETGGTVTLAADRPTFNVQGSLQRMDLPPLSPYAREAIGWNLNNGQLSADWEGKAEAGILDIDIDLLLARLDIEKPDDENKLVDGLSGMPLKTSLNMLKDRQGDIKLTIPVEGDMSAPEFGWGSVTAKAVQAGVKQATVGILAPMGLQMLTNVALPPGTLFIAGKLVKFVATVRFDPLYYTPGEVALSQEEKDRVDSIVNVMKDQPNIRLLLSGVAVPADLVDPEESASKSKTDSEKTTATAINDEARKKRLLDLAKQRTKVLRNLLVKKGVDPARLFPALPQIDTDAQARPRVELGA